MLAFYFLGFFTQHSYFFIHCVEVFCVFGAYALCVLLILTLAVFNVLVQPCKELLLHLGYPRRQLAVGIFFRAGEVHVYGDSLFFQQHLPLGTVKARAVCAVKGV